jgi:hypothetical protein
MGGEAAAVVGQPLDGLRGPEGVEAALDCEQDEVAYGGPADAARAGVRWSGDAVQAASTRFERATCSVSATAFIGNRPDRATASATTVFLPVRR